MAQWGIPGTEQRVNAIYRHIAMKCIGLERPDADTFEAEAAWRSDLRWLEEIVVDQQHLSTDVPLTTDGCCGAELRSTSLQLTNEGYFDPKALADERKRKLREIVQRRGQSDFRASLLHAYEGRCAVTGCDAASALEAAHVMPYLGPQWNHVSNGLLLRADIHTLFDLDLIGVDPTSMRVVLAEHLHGTCYDDINGRALAIPLDTGLQASKDALLERWKQFVRAQQPSA